jgi:hypothetical protein
MAACYPGSPVDAVRLQSRPTAPLLWFRADLMSLLFFQRQHCSGTSHYSQAGAWTQHFNAAGSWDQRVTSERFQTSLGNALDSFAALQVKCSDPQLLGLAPAGVADCCAVCSQGYMGFLQEQDAVRMQDGYPARGPAGDNSPDPAPDQHPSPEQQQQGQQQQQDHQQHQQPPQQQQQQQHPSQHQAHEQHWQEQPPQWHQPEQQGSQQQQQQQEQQQQREDAQSCPLPDTPPAASAELASDSQGDALLSNPLPAFEPYMQPLVMLYCFLDGLMRVPHLAKAGKLFTCR